MMKYSSLKNTKKNLTVIFTLLVFFIAVLLEFVFFTAKYYNYTYSEKKIFDSVTSKVENKYVSLKEFISTYDIGKKLFKMGTGVNSKIDKISREDLVNIIVIDKEKTELVFSNVVDNISLKFVQESLHHKYSSIMQKEGYLVKKIFVKEGNKEFDVLFIKGLRYNFGDYLTDLLGFILITSFFSIFFYIIGLTFVSKILQPVEENMKGMQDFIHNAGHELKTPIAIIHSNLQLIKETQKFEKDLIQEGIIEVSRLNHLIESLVELSNINSIKNKQKLDIKTEVSEIINDFKVESDKKNIIIKVINLGQLSLKVNKQHFYILFSNLLGNAIKYSKVGGKIEILIEKNGLTIRDNGIGISKENLDKIFDRFYMVQESRNNKGHGIGLSLVKKIINIYKWKIKVNSVESVKSEFRIEF